MRKDVLYKVFLNLRKSYNALDMECYREILFRYRIGLRIERIIRLYWEHLLMVARVGNYYGYP